MVLGKTKKPRIGAACGRASGSRHRTRAGAAVIRRRMLQKLWFMRLL
jgi:hypothetical protein